MKPIFKSAVARIALASFFMVGFQRTAFAQGSLTPPGPPGPTMKTLQQVEPRTPVPALPATITTPGSYYLTSNGTVTGTAILVRSGDVTLDLNGFTVSGDGGNFEYGVWIDPTNRVRNVTVRNGNFYNFSAGIMVGGIGVENVLLENIQMNTGPSYGIWIASGSCDGVVVRNNILVGMTGISVGSSVGQTARSITICNNRIFATGNNLGISLNALNGPIRDVAILNNQIAAVSGTPIYVSTTGTGTVSRVLVDGNHCTKAGVGIGILVPTNSAATVIRNVLTGGTMGVATNGNTIGPTISTTGLLGTNGAAMSPWANFLN